ncbi:hypothetical protein HKBW3S42_00050 [Candidatus Hakubella thermalkaliphila]|uniref:Uncharacterized protein n=1 Tax=Candidatus Hakubella thermalkaliphila TaxID=2754717 RepID=A0A6V8PHI3_9ACTN|nr:hypothetical protein HKBW3S42_00050 [Candidatus Hakubella thermalkaliphila]
MLHRQPAVPQTGLNSGGPHPTASARHSHSALQNTGLPGAACIPTSCLQVDALLHYTKNFPASPPLPYGRGLLGGEAKGRKGGELSYPRILLRSPSTAEIDSSWAFFLDDRPDTFPKVPLPGQLLCSVRIFPATVEEISRKAIGEGGEKIRRCSQRRLWWAGKSHIPIPHPPKSKENLRPSRGDPHRQHTSRMGW